MGVKFKERWLNFLFIGGIFWGLLFFQTQAATARDLVVGLDTEIDRLVPYKVTTPKTFPVSMQIYEGLFDLNKEGEVIPVLVNNYKTEDFQKWTFHIRQGVKFHHSSIFPDKTREVTADDVVYSLKKFCSPDSYPAFLLLDSIKGAKEFNNGESNSIEGIKKTGRYTVNIDLVKPEPFFINRISTPWVVVFPKEMDAPDNKEKSGFSLSVGTGPYMLVSQTDTEIVLTRNPHYWDDRNTPWLEKIVFRVIKNDQVRILNLQKKNIDMIVLSASMLPSVFRRDGSLRRTFENHYTIKKIETYNVNFIGINTSMITDLNLRKAMYYGVDRQEIVDTVLYGFADVMGGAVPAGIGGYQPPFAKDSLFDPEKAARFLKKSNYQGEPLDLLIHDIESSETVGQIFQAQMAALGIIISLNKTDFGTAVNRVITGKAPLFSMFLEYVFSAPEPIMINLFHSSKVPVPNFFALQSEDVDKKLDSFYNSVSMEEKEPTVGVARKIMENIPMVPLYRAQRIFVFPSDLKDLEVTGNFHIKFEKIRPKP